MFISLNISESQKAKLSFFKQYKLEGKLEKGFLLDFQTLSLKLLESKEEKDAFRDFLNRIRKTCPKNETFEGIIVSTVFFDFDIFQNMTDIVNELDLMLIHISQDIHYSRTPILITSVSENGNTDFKQIEEFLNSEFPKKYKCYDLTVLSSYNDRQALLLKDFFDSCEPYKEIKINESSAHILMQFSNLITISRLYFCSKIDELEKQQIAPSNIDELVKYMQLNAISSACQIKDIISVSIPSYQGSSIYTSVEDDRGFWSLNSKGDSENTNIIDQHIMKLDGFTIAEKDFSSHIKQNDTTLTKNLYKIFKHIEEV